jgi:hypothetical protein
MKTTILISFFAFIFGNAHSQTGNQNQPTTSEFKVYGECEMCKSRIEKAAKVDGVTSAIWDKETKILKVEFLPSKVKVEKVSTRISQKPVMILKSKKLMMQLTINCPSAANTKEARIIRDISIKSLFKNSELCSTN